MRIRQYGWQPLAHGCNEPKRPIGALRTYRNKNENPRRHRSTVGGVHNAPFQGSCDTFRLD
jgi:hypothetical protein